MRELIEHKVNPANDVISVEAVDEPGSGGAHHAYDVTWTDPEDMQGICIIRFQNGPIDEVGVNGITHEVLLAILADRLRDFQAGKFACHENAEALRCIENAQNWLNRRTLARMRRGVEGTHQV